MPPPDPTDSQDRFDELSGGETGGSVPSDPEVTDALRGVVGLADAADEFAGVIDIGDRYLGLSTTGIGPKLQIAQTRESYAPLGTDCVAMTVNDLLADGLTPVCYVNHLSVAESDESIAGPIARGIAEAAEQAGILLLGGDMSVAPETVAAFDLVGTAAGVGEETEVFPGEAATGDRLVGFPATGIHPEGVGFARSVLEDSHELSDPLPGSDTATLGDALAQPLRLYTYLLDTLREADVHAAVHLAAGGWPRLSRMGDYRYSITEPFEPPAIFDLLEDAGGLSLQELYRRYAMGTGFVLAAPESVATEIAAATDGRIIGVVEQGSGVSIRGMDLEEDGAR